MARSSNPGNPARFVVFLGVMVAAHIAAAQDATPLLRLQRSIAALEIESNVKHAQGLSGVTTGNPGDIWRYPNSCRVCLSTATAASWRKETKRQWANQKPSWPKARSPRKN